MGANTGDYALMANQLVPGAKIHAFEPLPSTFKILESRLAGTPGVRLNNFGLGAGEQVIQLHHHGEGEVTASAFPLGLELQDGHPLQSTPIRIFRGDDYAKAAGVSKVDFLKIDVEGMEFEVMQGFGGFLGANVDCVQFEYGVFNIASNYFCSAIYAASSVGAGICGW